MHLEINDDDSTRLQPKLNGADHSKSMAKKRWINPTDTKWKAARWNKYVIIQHSMNVIQHSQANPTLVIGMYVIP